MYNTTFDINEINSNNLNKQYIRQKNNKIIKLDLYERRKNNQDAQGGLFSSLRDWLKIVSFNQYAYPARNDIDCNILKRSSIREMHHTFSNSSILIKNNKLKSQVKKYNKYIFYIL